MSSPRPELKLAFCSAQAARYACENWHYSKCMPAGKLIKVGVWENNYFVGVVIFGRGANNNLLSPYKLSQIQGCELVRVALSSIHVSAVSKIVSIAIRFLRNLCPNLRIIVSFADPDQGHLGIVYQAMNWTYTGKTKPQREVIVNGKIMHKRTANSLFGSIRGLEKSKLMWKHKYIYPLDKEMRKQIQPLSKPYPKRAGSIDSDAASFQDEQGGASPTPALQGIS